jgi:hypothetical protein
MCHIGNLLKFIELVQNKERVIGTSGSDVGGLCAADRVK